MDAPTMREKLINKILNDLDDEQVNELFRYTETLQAFKLPDDYDEENDPTVGFFSGPPDLAERSEEILRDEITRRSGWTQKESLDSE